VRRLFWLGLGIGLGAVTAVTGLRWSRRRVERPAPRAVAREAKGGLLDLTKLVAASLEEGRVAMADREAELRARRDPGAR
jgi:hypothetical protein